MRITLCLLLGCFLVRLSLAQPGAGMSFQSPFFNKIENVLVSRDSQVVIATDSAGYVLFWQKNDGALTKIMRAHNQSVQQIVLSDDGKYFATASSDSSIILWNLTTGMKTGEISLDAPSTALAFADESDALLYAAGNAVYRTELTNLDRSTEIFHAGDTIRCGAEMGDGKYLAVLYKDSLVLVSANGGEVSKNKICNDGYFLESTSTHLYTVCNKNNILLFELKGTALHQEKQIVVPVSSPESMFLLATDENAIVKTPGGTQLWDWRSNKVFSAAGLPESATALGKAGRLVLAGNGNGQVVLRKVSATGEPKKAKEQKVKEPKGGEDAVPFKERKVRLKDAVEVQSAQLDIYVWDDENVDGDIISLSMNGNIVIEKYMVTKEKKKITLHLEPGKKNTLVLYAENLGKTPPNTAVISFHDGNTERVLTLNSDLKRSEAVNFILKK